jgi:curved DNA-binding protein CbpA
MYFSTCKTLEELKRVYHKLAKEFHPDAPNGSTEKMKELNSEYEVMFEKLKNRHFNADRGEYYESEKTTTEAPEDFINLVAFLSRFEGITLEICGTWAWVGGNTYPVKEELKEYGFRWSNSKKLWYYVDGIENMKWTRHGKNMKDIRSRYGSENIELGKQQKIS